MYKKGFIFLVLLLFPLIFLMSIVLNGQQEINFYENRKNKVFEDVLNSNFFDGSFQDNLEKTLSDQFPFSQNIKKNFFESNNLINFNILKNTLDYNCNKFRNDFGNYKLLGCSHYAVFSKMDFGFFKEKIDLIYKLFENDNINNFFYFIPDSYFFKDDIKDGLDNIFIDYLKEKSLKDNIKLDNLKIKTVDEYKKYFYQSDHHWNHLGYYEGYLDIMKLLGNEKDILRPIKQHVFKKTFCGSFCRNSGIISYDNTFSVYLFDYPKLDIYINGEKSTYGLEKEYVLYNWELNDNLNYYGGIFGGNFKEIKFISENKNNKNLLIISNSFVNPLNKLIAKSYTNTYVLDYRYFPFKNYEGFKQYVKEKEITDFLIVGNSFLINEFNLER